MSAADVIEIRRLRIVTHIGVPDEERSEPQTLLVTLLMTPSQGFDGLEDDIARTVDYYAVSLEIEALAAEKPRCLIETLAVDIADHLLSRHPLSRVKVTIEKHILPNTECVAVHLERSV
ncbi:MAG: dihydroneopterin aldolase [Luteolibacter sp.]